MKKLQLSYMRVLRNTLVKITNEHMGSSCVLFVHTDVTDRRHTDRCEKNVERKNKRLNVRANGFESWARSSSASPARRAPFTASA